jgi:hypothetical protein
MDNLWKSSKVFIDGAGAAGSAFAHNMIHGNYE